MAKSNSLGTATIGTQYYDGVATYTGVAGTTGQALIANTAAAPAFGTLGPSGGGTGSSTTFTEGSVVFAGAAGVYTQNNADFFWDNTNIRLGIGTNAPGVQTTAGRSYLTIKGDTGIGVFEMTTSQADGDGVGLGLLTWSDSNSINADKRSALIAVNLSGASADDRGSLMTIQTKADAGALATAMRISNTQKVFVGANTNPLNALDIGGAVAIGSYAGVNTAPSNGLIVSGQTAVGIASPNAATAFQVNTTGRINTILTGTQTTTDGNNQHCVVSSSTLAPSSATTNCNFFLATGTITGASGAVTSGSAFRSIVTGAATITNLYGFKSDAHAGACTNTYGGFFDQQTVGSTSNTSLYSYNMAIGSYTATTPPANGLICSGSAAFGASAIPDSYPLSVTSSTAKGFAIIQTGTGDIDINLQRTAGTTSTWQFYIPTGSSDLRFYNASDRVVFQTDGDILASTGNFSIETAGKGINIKEGANARMGTATLDGGTPATVVVNTTAVTANSRIQITGQTLGTITIGAGYSVSARTAGTSFTITSSAATDTSVVAWVIFEPA